MRQSGVSAVSVVHDSATAFNAGTYSSTEWSIRSGDATSSVHLTSSNQYGDTENSLLEYETSMVADSGNFPWVWTANNGAANSADTYKYGSKSGKFIAANGNYTRASYNAAMNLGSSNWTFDWWEYRTASGGTTMKRQCVASNGNAKWAMGSLGWPFAGAMGFGVYYAGGGSTSWYNAGAPTYNAWTHWAFVRSGSSFYVFKNGTQVTAWSSAAALESHASEDVCMGYGEGFFSGYVDNMRFTAGTARWTSNFIPPSPSAYAASGTYTSSVINGGEEMNWGTLNAVTNVPSGTSLTIATRSGNTAVPDGSWSAWQNLSGVDVQSPNSRYLQYRVTYATGNSAVSPALYSVTLNQVPTNIPPVASDDAGYLTQENYPLTVDAASGVLANDTDANGNALTAVLGADVSHGTLNLAADGSFSYVPDPNWFGTDTFTYRAFDGLAYSSVATATIGVSMGPPAPPGTVCRGNVCSGSVAVGSRTVEYFYTQHVHPDGQLRVRLIGGDYATAQLISHIVFGLPPFVAWDKFANPHDGSIYLPEEDVNPGRTAYERRDSDGCVGCRVDQVLTFAFSGLAATEEGYEFNLYFLQEGATGSRYGLKFYVDAAAPTNTDESFVWGVLPGLDLPCADHEPPGAGNPGVDNDLDYYANCADPQCAGFVGDVVSGMTCESPETTCHDGFDNDGDNLFDCQDPDCDGRVGRPGAGMIPAAYCQHLNEAGAIGSLLGTSPCGDNFDNDADGRVDCYDNVKRNALGVPLPSLVDPVAAMADAAVCWRHPAYGCPVSEISCNDGMDNDIDVPYSADEYPETGVVAGTVPPSVGWDCRDYDCAGSPDCPPKENQDKNGAWQDNQCFDGIDNDLDSRRDCGDVDCQGVEDPVSGFLCQEKEFDLGQRVQFCGNYFDPAMTQPVDDDGDGQANCQDNDCSRRFGWCGPCPNREDFTYDSCANGKDEDDDGLIDCADSDCLGKLGDVVSMARCAAVENAADICADGFDNDGDGDVDCADAGCAGVGPVGRVCLASESGASACADGFDNDGDGDVDCADAGCAGIGSCHARDWLASASCDEVPGWSPWEIFVSGNPTLSVRSYRTTRVSTVDRVQLTGSAAYESLTVVVGDNVNPLGYYPYASTVDCSLSGVGSEKMDTVIVDGHAVMFFARLGETVSDFDVTLECATSALPQATRNYAVAVSALLADGSIEYGEVPLSTRLFEGTPPTVVEVEPEGEQAGVWKVPFGQSRRLRIVPSEPFQPDPLLSSGICRCQATVAGTAYQSADGDCLVAPAAALFANDVPALAVSAMTRDGAGNDSPVVGLSVNLNVTPAINVPLTIAPPNGRSKPFFDDRTANAISLNASFVTALNDDWGVAPTCLVYVRNSSGAIIGGPGPSATFVSLSLPGSPLLACQATLSAPTFPLASMPDGEYSVTVAGTDRDGDFIATDPRPLYVCRNVPQSNDENPGHVCHWADFDGDGSAEGYYTGLYSADAKSCDNCVNLHNPAQGDRNADGVGDDCSGILGRCEVDRDYVCQRDSYDYDSLLREPAQCPAGARCCVSAADPSCCPAPSYGDDDELLPPAPRLQGCRDPWGICSMTGDICFDQGDCPELGHCADDDLLCNEDTDCELDGSIECVGAQRCDGLMYPWVQASFGNVFTQLSLRGGEPPPTPNATYCLTAKNQIQDFESSECVKSEDDRAEDARTRLTRPQPQNAFAGAIGRVDVAGLLLGKYGPVVTYADSDEFNANFPPFLGQPLGGAVYVVEGDLTVRAGAQPRLMPEAGIGRRGNGTVIVRGNLRFDVDVTYAVGIGDPLASLSRLASVGWVVLGDGSGVTGDLYVSGGVTEIVGAFLVAGTGGFWSVAPPDTESAVPLTIRGLMIARQFHLSRSFRDLTQGSERVIYDGRAVVNPPPGFADAAKALPSFTDLPD